MDAANASEEKYYQGLYEIATALNSVREPNGSLGTMVEMVAKAMEAKACSLMLLAPNKRTLVHRTAFGLSDRYMRKGPVSADRSMAEALQGRPVAILKAADDERIQYRKQAEEEGIASILSVPVTLRDEVVGVIRVYTAETRHFSAGDMFFVGAVANLGAIALENATLREAREKEYQSLQQDMAEWTTALGWEWMAQGTVVPAREQD